MDWYWAAALLFGLGVGLMFLGIPVAIAFFATNIIGAVFFMGGGGGIAQVINNGFGAMTNFALVPIPMFLLMGELFYHTGLATKCFNAADKMLGSSKPDKLRDSILAPACPKDSQADHARWTGRR